MMKTFSGGPPDHPPSENYQETVKPQVLGAKPLNVNFIQQALQMRRICRWLIRFKLSPLDLRMQRRQKQIQPTDLKTRAIGAIVRELRERAGHSQEHLSDECGFDRTYISRVERGIINPTVGRLWKIADALETPLSQFAKRMEAWLADRPPSSTRRSDSKRL